ncbi:MAG TPA: hypothetical protein VNH44_11055, partial [Micropepsaceae bacterium]|nr:hypothetical protein [Micropepsaceae bacterium]
HRRGKLTRIGIAVLIQVKLEAAAAKSLPAVPGMVNIPLILICENGGRGDLPHASQAAPFLPALPGVRQP